MLLSKRSVTRCCVVAEEEVSSGKAQPEQSVPAGLHTSVPAVPLFPQARDRRFPVELIERAYDSPDEKKSLCEK